LNPKKGKLSAMTELEQLRQENTELRSEVLALRKELQTALGIMKRIEIENKTLKTELETLKRKQARQTAPHSRNQKKINPKVSGRKKGIGEFKYRSPPKNEEITEYLAVPIVEPLCPECRTELPKEPSGIRLVWLTDLGGLKPSITEYQLEQKTCVKCGIRVEAIHPKIDHTQRGATAHRIGSHALSVAHCLQYEMGIPARKVPLVLLLTTGLRITQSAITQSAIGHTLEGQVIQNEYQKLRSSIKASAMTNTDDTGWRVNAELAFVMGFKTATAVVYQIRQQHRSLEVEELIPQDYAGVLVTDRFVTYDAKLFSKVKQQKCFSHLLKNTRVMIDQAKGRAKDFPLAIRSSLKSALKLHNRFKTGTVSKRQFGISAKRWKTVLTKQLRGRAKPLTRINERLRNDLNKHLIKGNLLRFLEMPEVSPTNNAAERILRPMVIFRKLCAGNKTWNRARALEAYSSVIQTARLNGSSGFEVLQQLYAAKVVSRR
jgi:transposase